MLVFATGRATRLASARYLLVDVADASLAKIDIGLLAAGPLWRLGRGMAYGVREGGLILDQRDRNPLSRLVHETAAALDEVDRRDAAVRPLHRIGCLGALGELPPLGMTMADVVKTRIYVVDPQHWKDSGRAHGEVFAGIRPALGWVYMSSFFAPGITVEVEATAYRAG